jgi:hypothetical protein
MPGAVLPDPDNGAIAADRDEQIGYVRVSSIAGREVGSREQADLERGVPLWWEQPGRVPPVCGVRSSNELQ